MRQRERREAGASGPEEMSVVEVMDERDPLCEAALRLIADSFPAHERHPSYLLRLEVEEKRLGLLSDYNYHLLAIPAEAEGGVAAAITGRYLAELNAGFITYLAVHPDYRRQRLGRRIREQLVEAFREDARQRGHSDLAWVLGEVQLESPWLHALVRHGRAIPFDLTYYHPGMDPDESDERYVLYRQPHLDTREAIPADELRRILYSVWRRGYRVGYPLQRAAFRAMIRELEDRETVGAHPEVLRLANG